MVDYVIREPRSCEEYSQIASIYQQVFDLGEPATPPGWLLEDSTKVGGLTLGLWHGDEAVGFSYAMVGLDDRGTYLYSSGLGVLRAHRSKQQALQLKVAQRQCALARGHTRLRWTYSALRSVNAHLYITRLGGTSSQYVLDTRGALGNDWPTEGGVLIDEFVVDWELNSERVRRRLGGEVSEFKFDELRCVTSCSKDLRGHVRLDEVLEIPQSDRIVCEVPLDFQTLVADALDVAQDWRTKTRPLFLELIQRGYRLSECIHDKDAQRVYYVFDRLAVQDTEDGGGESRASRGGQPAGQPTGGSPDASSIVRPDSLKRPDGGVNSVTAGATGIRRQVVKMVAGLGEGYLLQGLGAADIFAALYCSELRLDPSDPDHPSRDRFLLSTAHNSAGLYAALAQRGVLPAGALAGYGQDGSPMEIIASERVPGVEGTFGSLGQALSVAVGLALSARTQQEPWRVYALLGDGEMQEGQVWEAAMAAAAYRLGGLCLIVDLNGMQVEGATRDVLEMGAISAKWRAFGWAVVDVDGHDVLALLRAFDLARSDPGRPHAILAHTVPGHPISFLTGQINHYAKLSPAEADQALEELDAGKAGERLSAAGVT